MDAKTFAETFKGCEVEGKDASGSILKGKVVGYCDLNKRVLVDKVDGPDYSSQLKGKIAPFHFWSCTYIVDGDNIKNGFYAYPQDLRLLSGNKPAVQETKKAVPADRVMEILKASSQDTGLRGRWSENESIWD